MPNVSLDLRARAAQFPRVKRVIVAYDRVELLSLGAYKHAFPKLRSFKITEPRTPAPYGDWNALVARRRNQPANQLQLGYFEHLERVEMPMGALWILGLHMHIDVVVLSIDLSFPMTFLGEVLNDLRPRHLRMHFGSTEAASVLFNHSRTSFGSPTAIWFSILVLAIPLPSEVLQFGIILSSLVQNAKNFPCEDLIIEFSQKPLGSLTAVPVRATYLAHLNMEKVTRHIARNAGSNLRRLAVFVPNVAGVQLPGSMTIFVADATCAPLSAPVVQRSQQQILPVTWM
ncbi:hypothetical protein C2E23DRAFT_818530 [Lenzites betulinus]|nr:hypothetical protein C2E23DRAFT_818530 [Lenzites betulinus]